MFPRVFQLIVSATRWNPQYVLIGSISLGAILMPFGVMGILAGTLYANRHPEGFE